MDLYLCLHAPQCTVNGLNHGRVEKGGGLKTTVLEIFFFGYSRLVGLHHFPSLRKLCVMNQKIHSLSGLESCRNLEELWVCEGFVKAS